MNLKTLNLWLVWVPAALALNACGFTVYKNGVATDASVNSSPNSVGAAPTTTPPDNNNINPGQATFTLVSQQILQPRCVGCHYAGGNSPDLSSYVFAQNTSYIVPGNPSQSELYSVVASGQMPRGGQPLSQSELTLISDWISQGALDN